MNISELTLLVLRLGFLLLLWVFVFVVVYSLRADLFGSRTKKLPDASQPAPAPRQAAAPHAPSGSAPATELIGAAAAAARPSAPSLPPPAMPVPLPPSVPSLPPTGTNPLAGLARDRSSEPQRGAEKATLDTAKRLVITGGPRAGTEYALTSEPLTIGRSSESGLVVRDDYTSTHHARLMLWNGEWMLQDLDSTNGTFLDGERVTSPTQIPLDTPVKIGLTTFELRR